MRGALATAYPPRMHKLAPSELHEHEALALVALVRQLVVADGVVTVAELAQMNEVGQQLGVATYARIAARMEEHPVTVEHTLSLAATVTREGARALTLDLLDALAGADGLDATETALLDRVRLLWR